MTVTDEVRVVDADSHITEPRDLWTSRLPSKWQDLAPRTEIDPATGVERWVLDGKFLHSPGAVSHAGWKNFPPSRPPLYSDINPSCYDVGERVAWMDEHGVTVQLLYPNLVAFEGHTIMSLPDDGLKIAIFEAYNDFLAEYAQQAPGRFVPLAALPFWDIEASIGEMRRAAGKGHRGILWAATLDKHGLPPTTSAYWDPFYAEAQELGMSINFHVGVGWTEDEFAEMSGRNEAFNLNAHVGRTARSWMSNAKMISDLIMDGVCERFPNLNFVSVESGFGWVPFLLEGLDWQWRSMNGPAVVGGLLPTEYFKRQIYAMFWFEESSLRMMDLYPDSIMFETDFPHTTSLSPGPGSASPSPKDIIDRARKVLQPETFAKVMYGNAARVYHLDP